MQDSRTANAKDNANMRPKLLVWPSSLWEAECSNTAHEESGMGFVLGWSTTSDNWPADTMVVAGVEWLLTSSSCSSNDLEKEYKCLKRRIQMLQIQNYCCCSHHRVNNNHKHINGNKSRNPVDDLKIVAFVSSNDKDESFVQRAWLKTIKLPSIFLKNGYPHYFVMPEGNDRTSTTKLVVDQIVIYNSDTVYRHFLSGPGSSFGDILSWVTAACPLIKQLSNMKPSTMPTSAAAEAEPDTTMTSILNTNIPTTKGNRSGSLPVRSFLEKHSMLLYHFRSSTSNTKIVGNSSDTAHTYYFGWQWTPVCRLWHNVSKWWQQPNDDNNPRCFQCQKHMIHSTMPQKDVTNQIVSSALDLWVGLLCGVLLALGILSSKKGSLASFISSFYIDQHFLPNWLEWLESFPIGFKLNVSLTKFIGQEVRSLVILRRHLLKVIADTMQRYLECIPVGLFRYGTIVACTFLGGGGCLALVMDLLRLLTLHLSLLSEGFRCMVYSNELYLLATLWRLFRGKKQNILRQRTDTMEYDSMQLLLGSILFVMTLFLLTTVLVYYVFFTLLNLVVATWTTVVLFLFYTVLRDIPFGTCYLRLRHPEAFTSQVYLTDLTCSEAGDASCKPLVTRLEAVPESLGSILSSTPELRLRAGALQSWLRTSFSEILSGKPTSQTLVDCLTPDPRS